MFTAIDAVVTVSFLLVSVPFSVYCVRALRVLNDQYGWFTGQ